MLDQHPHVFQKLLKGRLAVMTDIVECLVGIAELQLKRSIHMLVPSAAKFDLKPQKV